MSVGQEGVEGQSKPLNLRPNNLHPLPNTIGMTLNRLDVLESNVEMCAFHRLEVPA